MFTAAERRQKVELYGRAYDILTDAIRELPREAWHFKPSEGWTIHQIIIHITDSEANSYVRCRRLLAEPGSPVLGYDENVWARALDYDTQSAEEAVELFKWLRKASYDLIKDRAEGAAANLVHHSESGPMTFDEWLDIYARHVPDHVAQMRRACEEFKRSKE